MAKKDGAGGCGCLILILVVNLTLGGFCADYSLGYYFGADAPWYGDAALGLVGGQVLIPATVLAWVLKLAGVRQPVWRLGGG